MDFETFGEHQWEDTGIFSFLRELPSRILSHGDTTFRTPTETVMALPAVGELDVPHVLTWADTDRDLTAWTGNDIQKDALRATYALENDVLKTGNTEYVETWRRLQTSDHFYYMCTKWFEDGDVHAYFSPYESPYDAYIAFMNALRDLQLRVTDALDTKAVCVAPEVKQSWWMRGIAWIQRIARQGIFIGRHFLAKVSQYFNSIRVYANKKRDNSKGSKKLHKNKTKKRKGAKARSRTR
jgi:alpha-amylase/alpha-mannosidase (GH57 family)